MKKEEKIEAKRALKGKRVKEKEESKGKKRTGCKIFLVILLIILIASGIFVYKVYKNGWGMSGIIATTLGHNEETLKNLPPLNFVLIGESENLSDTILLCSYNPKTR